MLTTELLFIACITLAGISYIAVRLIKSASRIRKNHRYANEGISAIVVSLYGMYLDIIYHCLTLEKCSIGEECYGCLAIFFVFAIIGLFGFYLIRR